MPKYISASLTFCLTGAWPPPPALPVGVKLIDALPLTWGCVACLVTTGVPGRVVRVATGAAGIGTGVTVGPAVNGAGGGPSAGRHCGLVVLALDDGAGELVTGRAVAGIGVTVA